MKNKFEITGVNITILDELILSMGSIYIHRRKQCRHYKITTLTQYQRAVRLLTAFVERSMR